MLYPIKLSHETQQLFFSHIVDDLVSLPHVDKVDTLRVKSVTFSLYHLVGLFVLHLFKHKYKSYITNQSGTPGGCCHRNWLIG